VPQITKEKDLMKSNVQHSTCADDEIDLKELILALWHRKLFIILCTLVAIIARSMYVNIQPNIYEAKAVFKINAAPYGVSGRSAGDAFLPEQYRNPNEF